MALVPCTECNKEISELALACPNCGAPTPAGIRDRAEQDAANTRAQAERDAASQRAQASQDARHLIEEAAKARRKRRGNTQGCGCLLILLAGLMVLTAVGGPLAIGVGILGALILLIGLFV